MHTIDMEQIIGTVRSRATSASLALTIPSLLRAKHGFEKGDHFVVKIDEQDRIIYEKIPDRQGTATNEDPACQEPTHPHIEVSR